MEEAGVPGLYASFWHGLWAPKGTPKDIIARLNSAVRSALADPMVRQRYTDQGQAIPPPDQQTPGALGKLQKAAMEVVADHQGCWHQGGVSRRTGSHYSIGGRHETCP